ncbi:chaplin [Streptomyces oryzae]|uniref:chaplin n=1 Tax=Streptomyces oryzae TaxID=1434886 RepID=UPI001FFE290C|nr:chaplin [Streptomyces oryzae]
MRKVLSKSLLTAAATTGALAGAAGYAQADAGAGGGAAGSPGFGSGNVVKAPVHVPASVCGNTIDVVGALNPSFGNHCGPGHISRTPSHHQPPAQGPKKPPQRAEEQPPKGAQEQPPVRAPEKPAPQKPADQVENRTEKPAGHRHAEERAPEAAKAAPARPAHEAAPAAPRAAEHEVAAAESLAETGAGGAWGTAALGVGTLLGGLVLYRRATPRRM